jgi:hypothetical protein
MNVKQLIEKYENILKKSVPFTVVNIHGVLRDLKQLDEPHKVKVPQFVADLLEFAKLNDWDLEDVFEDVRNEHSDTEISEWFYQKKNMDILARAWLDGYEVEKEPKYTVKFKATNQYLCDDDGIGLHISPSFRSNFRKSDLEKLSLTEVFDSPLFEVEEV